MPAPMARIEMEGGRQTRPAYIDKGRRLRAGVHLSRALEGAAGWGVFTLISAPRR